jgi:hypothetical protein
MGLEGVPESLHLVPVCLDYIDILYQIPPPLFKEYLRDTIGSVYGVRREVGSRLP